MPNRDDLSNKYERPNQAEKNLRFAIRSLIGVWAIALLIFGSTLCLAQQQKVILVVGTPGQPEYGKQFADWADQWESAVKTATSELADESVDDPDSKPSIEFVKIGLGNEGDVADIERLRQELEVTANDKTSELWIVLIGHGTFDRKAAKFNLRGTDVTADQLSKWLDPLPCQTIVINCASASGPFINKVAGRNRIVVTATKSGDQYNFARFGRYLAQSIGDPTIDLDKDQQTSLLEAFLAASARAQEFYVEETRLATELALIDDNGDGLGTPADWFQGTRAVKKPKKGKADGLAANQIFLVRRGSEARLSVEARKKRDQLEARLESLRERKSKLGEAAYYESLEPIMLELATIYDSAEASIEKEQPELETSNSR